MKDLLTGAVVGGLGSAGFYGAGKAVEELRGSGAGRGNNGVLYTPANPGPLNRDIAETFAGGSYTEVVLNKKTIF